MAGSGSLERSGLVLQTEMREYCLPHLLHLLHFPYLPHLLNPNVKEATVPVGRCLSGG